MSLVTGRYVSTLLITHDINVDFLFEWMFPRKKIPNYMMHVCIKSKTKDRKHENKTGLVSQKYYTNQKLIALLFLNEIIFEVIKKIGLNVAHGLFMGRLLIMDGQCL